VSRSPRALIPSEVRPEAKGFLLSVCERIQNELRLFWTLALMDGLPSRVAQLAKLLSQLRLIMDEAGKWESKLQGDERAFARPQMEWLRTMVDFATFEYDKRAKSLL
jgi:hypothetical protein